MDRDLLKRYLDEGLSLIEIGALVGRDPSTVGYWVRKHGLTANGRRKYSPAGRAHEGAARTACRGRTDSPRWRRAARPASTHHSLLAPEAWTQAREALANRRVNGSSSRRSYALPSALPQARRYGLPRAAQRAITVCEVQQGGGLGVAPPGEAEARRRGRRVLRDLRLRPLDRSPSVSITGTLPRKSFGLAMLGVTRSFEKLRQEAAKCVLLCANCHSEVEGGAATVP